MTTSNILPLTFLTTTNQSTGSFSAPNATVAPVPVSSNNTYTNGTDGISVIYPKGWGVEGGFNAANSTILGAIRTTPPLSEDPNLLTNVYIYKDTTPGIPSSINQYLRDNVDGLRSTEPNFRLLSATTGNTVAGHPGYLLQGSYSGPLVPLRVLEAGFLLGSNGYYVWYTAPPTLYSTFLPQVNGIIQSLKVTPP